MKTTHSFSTDFLIRRCKENKKRGLIYARITVDEERKEISLKEQIDVTDWDPKREIVKGKTEAVRSINQHIEDVRFRIKDKYRLLCDKEVLITAETVKQARLAGPFPRQKKPAGNCRRPSWKLAGRSFIRLRSCLKFYDAYKKEILACDQQIHSILFNFFPATELQALENKVLDNPIHKQVNRNSPSFNVRHLALAHLKTDLFQIPGVSHSTVLCLLCNMGNDIK